MDLFPFLMKRLLMNLLQEQFALCIALCIPTVHHFTRKMHGHLKAVFFCKKENSALSEHTCLTNHTIGWDNSKIITTNRRYHQRLCLEAWHINSAHAPLNRDDGGLLPDAYLHLVRKKAARQEFRNVGSMNCNFFGYIH